ncbi:hypothetical protein KKF84_10095 [Myxococcota bacterium]|nr:hypothetical protein [Myxococcota bacterium]MBU1535662.1 hypothetical protein [Myxococcota bacterium]
MKQLTLGFLTLLLLCCTPVFAGCDASDDTSVDKGCKSDQDCPLPDRQKCKVDLGICVGHTTTPGDIDGGTDDAGGDF